MCRQSCTVLAVFALVFVGCNAEREWFWYKTRDNPRCYYHEECFSMSCPPPNGVLCVWNEKIREGVCVCQQNGLGLKPSDLVDAGRP
ncbi:uncharacterized protein SOCE836_025080 [Sorangium cellulosum]|uniref:Uncharacterized protein n=1 Tax=Sorangium cellulosum TaxID=56 RepID=A0A4P2QKG3_SORCE|nr:uncharacterized protein SOCE836_025080 [Sorangium cellulosum]WCQ89799.1 hypothetical protein NQZ70_02491 [Sorangium sp. Soce836]